MVDFGFKKRINALLANTRARAGGRSVGVLGLVGSFLEYFKLGVELEKVSIESALLGVFAAQGGPICDCTLFAFGTLYCGVYTAELHESLIGKKIPPEFLYKFGVATGGLPDGNVIDYDVGIPETKGFPAPPKEMEIDWRGHEANHVEVVEVFEIVGSQMRTRFTQFGW